MELLSSEDSPSREIAAKSVSACLSAIEVYNKHDFKYREETFSILMMNAWELLLKARYIINNNDDVESVVKYEKVEDEDGKKVEQPKTNRSGNPITYGLEYLIEKLFHDKLNGITKATYDNIKLLIEARDNVIHFVVNDPKFSSKIYEIGTASLRNYLVLIQDWFEVDLSRYNFFLMPISFFHEFDAAEVASVEDYDQQMTNFLEYVNRVEEESGEPEDPMQNVTLTIESKVVRSKDSEALPFQWTDDPDAPSVSVKEEGALKNYPYTYRELCNKIDERYTNFKQNQRYHNIRQELEEESKYCKIRYLNPDNPRSRKKNFYNANIIQEFDNHYTKEST